MSKFSNFALLFHFILLLVVCGASADQILQPNGAELQQNETTEYYDDDSFAQDTELYLAKLKDWRSCNYSSEEHCTRDSIVRMGNNSYDPMSFRGGENDTYGE